MSNKFEIIQNMDEPEGFFYLVTMKGESKKFSKDELSTLLMLIIDFVKIGTSNFECEEKGVFCNYEEDAIEICDNLNSIGQIFSPGSSELRELGRRRRRNPKPSKKIFNYSEIDEPIPYAQYDDSEEFEYCFALFKGKNIDRREKIDIIPLLDMLIEIYGPEEVISGYTVGYKNCLLFIDKKTAVGAAKKLNGLTRSGIF